MVIFSYGANNNAAKSFGLKQEQICELTRVALRAHGVPASRVIAIALRLLKGLCPGIKVVFSYADKTNQGHHGGIYQAGNWDYLGERTSGMKGAYYFIKGKKMHGRSARAKYGAEKKFTKGWTHAPSETKHLYVRVLDPSYQLTKTLHPYPKRAGSKGTVASLDQREGGSATLTPALQQGGGIGTT